MGMPRTKHHKTFSKFLYDDILMMYNCKGDVREHRRQSTKGFQKDTMQIADDAHAFLLNHCSSSAIHSCAALVLYST